MMLFRFGELILLPIAWAGIVLGALQSKFLVSASTPSVCGPWGCGPDTAALVVMHASWLAAVGAPLIYFPLRLRWHKGTVRRLSIGLFVTGLACVLAIVAWQWFVWLPQAGSWSKDYIWQRCGFAVITAVDLPLFPLLLVPFVLWAINLRRTGSRTA